MSNNNREEVGGRLLHAVAHDNLVTLREILFRNQQQQQGGGGGGGVDDDDIIDQALMEAAGNGNVEAFDLLFNNGLTESGKQKYRNEENPSDFFPLHWAALRNHPEMVKFIVQDCQCNIDQLDNGMTALAMAGQSDIEITRFLLENGADPNKCGHNMWGKHPLFVALYHCGGEIELVRLLLEHGADPNFQRRPEANNRHGYNPIEDPPLADRAIAGANPEILTLMLQHGAILSTLRPGAILRVPLDFAALGGVLYRSRFLEMLRNRDYTTEQKLSICRVLVEHVASNDGNVKDYIQLHIDQVIGRFDTCFGETLLQSGVIPSNSQTMHTAVREGKVSICRLLVQNGVNPFQQENNNSNNNTTSLFQTAASRENTAVFELFLDVWDDERFSASSSTTTHHHHDRDNNAAAMHVVCGYSDVSLPTIQLLIERQGHTLMAVDKEYVLRPFLISSTQDANLDVIYTLLRQEPDALGRS